MRRNLGLRLAVAGVSWLLVACAGATVDAQTVGVETSSLKFLPASLEVAAGRPVRLTLTNQDALEHDFSILEFPVEGTVQTIGHSAHEMGAAAEQADLHVGAAANSAGTVQFTPSQPGTYEFFCAVPGHRVAGMVG